MANSQRLTPIQWTICVIAAIGFAFDTYELLMMPLILRPALLEMLGAAPNTPAFSLWRGLLFFIPALAGGIFGLLGGYLTDRLGRRRVLTWSILALCVFGVCSRLFDFGLDAAHPAVHDIHWRVASSSWPRSRGWRSFFRNQSSASGCSDIRSSLPRLAALWWRS